MSTFKVDNIQSSNTSPSVFRNVNGTEIGQLCKVWSNFSGVTTVTVNATFNVSSITRNGSGDYTIAFNISVVDGNYSLINGSGSYTTSSCSLISPNLKTSSPSGTVSLKSSSQVNIITGGVSGVTSSGDVVQVSSAIFR